MIYLELFWTFFLIGAFTFGGGYAMLPLIQKQVEAKYRDREGWARSAILNVACCGKFSSDRTIEEYVKDIWHLEKVTVEM